MATNCKSVQSTKELNQRLKRISDDLQDVHSKLNTVVAQQRRLDLPSFHHRGGVNFQQSFKRKRMMAQQNSLTMPSPHHPQLKSAAIAVNTITNNLKQSSYESEDDGSTGEIDDDDSVKPKLASSVVSTNRILRTREDLIGLVSDEPVNSSNNNNLHQGSNRQLEIRNRRMLSFVMSTLNEFKQHNDTYADQSVRRCQEVEDRRRRQAEEDNIRLQHERQMLVEKKRLFLDEQRAVIAEIERAEQIQYWNRTGSFLENSIRTDTEPSIFWRPALLEAKAKRKLDDSTLKVRHWIQLKLKGLESPNYNNKKEFEKIIRTEIDNKTTKSLIRHEPDSTICASSSSIEINEVDIVHPIIEDLMIESEEIDQADN